MTDTAATVRLKTIDGTWETVGVDRLRGVSASPPVLDWTTYGADTCSFQLRRRAGGIYPDLSAFTPAEIEVVGRPVWDGFVWQTPTQEGDDMVQVSGRGWQYHLDDDVIQRDYVHNRLNDFVDSRSLLQTNLAVFKQNGTVESGNGSITIGWPKDATIAANDKVGVTIDQGQAVPLMEPEGGIISIVVSWIPQAVFGLPVTDVSANCTISETSDPTGAGGGSWNRPFLFFPFNTMPNPATGAAGYSALNAAPFRYIHLWLNYLGAGGTLGADALWQISAVSWYRKQSYVSGNVSVFKASDGVIDALDSGAVPLLSSDRTGIQATQFSIPSYTMDSATTPRESINALNAYHDWLTKIDYGRRPIFKPQASAPLVEVGAWAGAKFADASTNNGENIYNRVRIEATGPDEGPLVVERYTTLGNARVGAISGPLITPAFRNGNFEGNATTGKDKWTVGGASILNVLTRSYALSGGNVLWWSLTGTATLNTTFKGIFRGGTLYSIDIPIMYFSETSAGNPNHTTDVPFTFRLDTLFTGGATVAQFTLPIGSTTTPDANPANGTWSSIQLLWTPTQDVGAVGLRMTGDFTGITGAGTQQVFFDNLSVRRYSTSNLCDRRGFTRTAVLPVQTAITTPEGNQIGDVFLSNHQSTPLAGQLEVNAPGGARMVLGGQQLHPAELGPLTGELVNFSHLIDPDTGGVGRSGRLAAVSYDCGSGIANCQIDTDVGRQEALLARLALVTGSKLGA